MATVTLNRPRSTAKEVRRDEGENPTELEVISAANELAIAPAFSLGQMLTYRNVSSISLDQTAGRRVADEPPALHTSVEWERLAYANEARRRGLGCRVIPSRASKVRSCGSTRRYALVKLGWISPSTVCVTATLRSCWLREST
jgi:hypothetical protein